MGEITSPTSPLEIRAKYIWPWEIGLIMGCAEFARFVLKTP